MALRSTRLKLFGLALALVSQMSGCDGDESAGPSGDALPFETGGEMLPGDNCRSCHGGPSSRYPDAPDWSFAGTVYAGPQSDEGVAGIEVTVVDATGAKISAVTNAVGNFYAPMPVVAPYSVSLGKGSRTITMAVPPPAGGCNACHSKKPVGGAPGRLFLPDGAFASAAECDEDHTVTVGDTDYDCAPYRCRVDPDECLRACSDASDCIDGSTCMQERCVKP